jgi:hypothetical protein
MYQCLKSTFELIVNWCFEKQKEIFALSMQQIDSHYLDHRLYLDTLPLNWEGGGKWSLLYNEVHFWKWKWRDSSQIVFIECQMDRQREKEFRSTLKAISVEMENQWICQQQVWGLTLDSPYCYAYYQMFIKKTPEINFFSDFMLWTGKVLIFFIEDLFWSMHGG